MHVAKGNRCVDATGPFPIWVTGRRLRRSPSRVFPSPGGSEVAPIGQLNGAVPKALQAASPVDRPTTSTLRYLRSAPTHFRWFDMQVRGLWVAGLLVASMACGSAGGLVPPSPPPPNSPPPTGSARIEDLGLFHSNILNNDRGLHVYLPPGYDAGSQRYPVLYVHDGADAFGSPPGYMGYDRTASALILAGTIRPLIIVAVNQLDRNNEYTPTRDASGLGGRGPLYARAVVEELKPMIDARYRTLTGPDDTGVGGKSLGGLISWYIVLAYPGVFHLMFAESGTLAWDNSWTVHQYQNLPAKLPVRIWFDRGTNDGELASHQANSLVRIALLTKGWIEGPDFMYLLAQGATHSEASFAARVDPIFRFLFPNP